MDKQEAPCACTKISHGARGLYEGYLTSVLVLLLAAAGSYSISYKSW